MSYIVASKVLGGDWVNYSLKGRVIEYDDLSVALGMAATLQSSIREVLVMQVTTLPSNPESDFRTVTKRYELVEYSGPKF